MCNQMLAYSGRSRFIVERVDLNALVQDTVRLLQVSITKDATIDLALDSELPEVEADVSQLRQVVMNLVLNASEALGEKAGEIRVSTRRSRPESLPGAIIHAFGLPPGESICLEIADTGVGMNHTTLARIFDPFFTTKFTGRGLGLAAVLGIVRAHQGTLVVHSAPGQGTRFRLYLSAQAKIPAVVPPAVPAPTAVARAAHGTILVADDEAVVLSTTDAVLRHYGYKTELAADGPEAVRLFRANPQGFAAVLLDMTMPGLSGAEVLREIRLINPVVRVLLMSGYSEQDVLARLKDQGAVAILHKPFTRQALLARLAEVVASS
jgi:CheY-like chemotaxis protein